MHNRILFINNRNELKFKGFYQLDCVKHQANFAICSHHKTKLPNFILQCLLYEPSTLYGWTRSPSESLFVCFFPLKVPVILVPRAQYFSRTLVCAFFKDIDRLRKVFGKTLCICLISPKDLNDDGLWDGMFFLVHNMECGSKMLGRMNKKCMPRVLFRSSN